MSSGGKNLENLSVGIDADASGFDRDVLAAAEQVGQAFGGLSPEITPAINADGASGRVGGLGEAIALMTRQSASIGTTLGAGFARVVPALEKMAELVDHIGKLARDIRLKAFEESMLKRQASALGESEKKLYGLAAKGAKLVGIWHGVGEAVGLVSGLLRRNKGFEPGKMEGGFSAVRMPGRALAGAAKGVGKGVAGGVGETLADAAEKAEGRFSVLSAVITGGIAGGVAALTTKTLEWAGACTWLNKVWEAIKARVSPFLEALAKAIEPAVTMLKAVGMAAMESFKAFLGFGSNGKAELSSFEQGIVDWVERTVDGGKIVTGALRAVGKAVATLADYWGYLKGIVLAVDSVIQRWAASALDALGMLAGGVGKLARMLGLAEGDWGGMFSGMSEKLRANADALMDSAGQAFASPGARDQVDKFFDDVEERAGRIFKRLNEDSTKWVWKFADQLRSQFDGMAEEASKLWDNLASPMDKLAEQFNKLDKLRGLGFLGEDDYNKLKSKAAGEFLGDSAAKNPAALEAGSREARSALLEWQNSQRDPLRELPNIQREQLAVAQEHKRFLQQIADALSAHSSEIDAFVMGNG